LLVRSQSQIDKGAAGVGLGTNVLQEILRY
jgi:hypothetical protein